MEEKKFATPMDEKKWSDLLREAARLRLQRHEASIAQRQVHEYKWNEIERMMHNPHEKLGSGGFGSVYSGVLPDGSLVAIKILGEEQRRAALSSSDAKIFVNQAFQKEISVLGQFKHKNIVRLLGWGKGTDERCALVYELLHRGSLHDALHNTPPSQRLQASQRISIAIDVARGLTFLHGFVPEQPEGNGGDLDRATLHRDIKSANICLDLDNVAKLIDCGMAKILLAGSTAKTLMSISGGVCLGTPGYIAPEVQNGKYAISSEVYSFGVVLLELLTGKPPQNLVEHIKDAIEDKGKASFLQHFATDWVEQCGWPSEALDQLRDLSLKCVDRRPKNRPANIRVVLSQLLAIQNLFHSPEQSAPCDQLIDVASLRARLQWLEAQLQQPPVADPEEKKFAEDTSAECVICLCDYPLSEGVLCENGHFVCKDDLASYVQSECDPDLSVETLKSQGRPAGEVLCPRHRPRGPEACSSAPFTAGDIAQQVPEPVFQRYMNLMLRLREQAIFEQANHRLVQHVNAVNEQLSEERSRVRIVASREMLAEALKRQVPDARQCGNCGHGPIDHGGCYDLTTHHNERQRNGRVNNACPRCSWFAPEIAMWPRWDGNLPPEVDATTEQQPQQHQQQPPSAARMGGGMFGLGGMENQIENDINEMSEDFQLALALDQSLQERPHAQRQFNHQEQLRERHQQLQLEQLHQQYREQLHQQEQQQLQSEPFELQLQQLYQQQQQLQPEQFEQQLQLLLQQEQLEQTTDRDRGRGRGRGRGRHMHFFEPVPPSGGNPHQIGRDNLRQLQETQQQQLLQERMQQQLQQEREQIQRERAQLQRERERQEERKRKEQEEERRNDAAERRESERRRRLTGLVALAFLANQSGSRSSAPPFMRWR